MINISELSDGEVREMVDFLTAILRRRNYGIPDPSRVSPIRAHLRSLRRLYMQAQAED